MFDTETLERELKRLTTLCKLFGGQEERADLLSLLSGFEGVTSVLELEQLRAGVGKLGSRLEVLKSAGTAKTM